MLSETFFSTNDAARLESSYKKFQRIAYLTLVIGIPLEFLIAYAASIKFPLVFWPFLIIQLAFLLSIFYFIFFKRVKVFRQDVNTQMKLVGSLEVISKSEKSKQFVVGFKSDELEQIGVAKAVYDRIAIGDTLSIEFSKYAHYIFKMSKDDDMMIQGDKL